MIRFGRYALPLALITLIAMPAYSAAPQPYLYKWSTVVNNGDYIPSETCDPKTPGASCRKFNSYNQPSINAGGLVVIRARSRGGSGGEPAHGVYARNMAVAGPVVKVFDRATVVPQPNNLGTPFNEPPSFPRIDIASDTVASRANHQPVWQVLNDERLGTSGIYTNPFGPLITGASKLGAVSDFSFFEVPEFPGTFFDVFPGAPSVTNGDIIVFKGNYTLDLGAKTGVYFRELTNAPIPVPGAALTPAGGILPVVLIANNTDSLIPGTTTVFGSTAPPSAANGMAVFAGFDNEESPTLGGIYLAALSGPQPPLTPLVRIGQQVPGESSGTGFNKLGEGVSFDGRFVAFWGSWGTATKTVVLQCRTDGNRQRVEFCQNLYPNGFAVQVPVYQGVFVHDLRTRQTQAVAKTPADFDDFLYWNFSGHIPGSAEEEDGEPARWRSSAFVAVSGLVHGNLDDPEFHAAFKSRRGDVVDGSYVNPIDGIYLARGGPGKSEMTPLVETGMDGTLLDSEAVETETGAPLPVTEIGIERDGFRGRFIVINASMGSEETGWAGIYLTDARSRARGNASAGGRKQSKRNSSR